MNEQIVRHQLFSATLQPPDLTACQKEQAPIYQHELKELGRNLVVLVVGIACANCNRVQPL
jgi:hypothetical protein